MARFTALVVLLGSLACGACAWAAPQDPAPEPDGEAYVPRPLVSSGPDFSFLEDAQWSLGASYVASRLHGTFADYFGMFGTPDRLNARRGLGLGTGAGGRLHIGMEKDRWRFGVSVTVIQFDGTGVMPRDFQIGNVVFASGSTVESSLQHTRTDLSAGHTYYEKDGLSLDFRLILCINVGQYTATGTLAGGGSAVSDSNVGGASPVAALGLQKQAGDFFWGLEAESTLPTPVAALATAMFSGFGDTNQILVRFGAGLTARAGTRIGSDASLSFSAGISYEAWSQYDDGDFPATKREYPAMLTTHAGLTLQVKF